MDPNTPAAIQADYARSGRAWWPVLALLPARLIFASLTQIAVTALAAGLGAADPAREAVKWWPVYLTVTDGLCLLILAGLARREGLRLRQLFGVTGWTDLRQLLWLPVYLLAVAPGVVAAHLLTTAFYGAELPPMLAVVALPPAGAAYAVLVWPAIWAVTEELVYLGFLLPRLEARLGGAGRAALVVVVFWGLQHLSMPFLPDPTYLAARPLAAGAAISCFPAVFIWGRRRLLPLIGVHYLADLATALLIAG